MADLKSKAPHPFDLESLRLAQDFASSVGVQKLLTTVPVRKPNKQDFFQVHPDAAYQLDTAVLEMKEDQEVYLASPSIRQEIGHEVIPVRIFTCLNRQGVLFLWCCKLPGLDGRTNPWHASALEAAEEAQKAWIRLQANMSLGAYEVFKAVADLPPPEWPELSFQEILKIAFKDGMIDGLDHPVLKRLRGEL